jgi:hypothetical protein
MATDDKNKAAEAITEIDNVLIKYQQELPPHVFDAVLSYVKYRYMYGL